MTLDFGKRSSDLVSRNFKALNGHFELIRLGGDRNVILLFAYEKTHCVQCQLKFRRGTNKARSNRFFNTLPCELNGEELIVVIRLCFVTTAGLDVATIIKITSLFFQVQLNPVVKTTDLAVLT